MPRLYRRFGPVSAIPRFQARNPILSQNQNNQTGLDPISGTKTASQPANSRIEIPMHFGIVLRKFFACSNKRLKLSRESLLPARRQVDLAMIAINATLIKKNEKIDVHCIVEAVSTRHQSLARSLHGTHSFCGRPLESLLRNCSNRPRSIRQSPCPGRSFANRIHGAPNQTLLQ